MFINKGNGHSNPSSKPGQGCLNCTNTLGKGMHPTIFSPAMSK